MRISRILAMFVLLVCTSGCKSLESSSELSALGESMTLNGRPIHLYYLKHVMRGNDDTIGSTPESQHETALLEFAIYDEQGELWLDYTFFSPSFPAVRTQVEVGIRSNFAIRQIVNADLVNSIVSSQGRAANPYFYPRHLRSAILTTNTRRFNVSRSGFRFFNTAERNGIQQMEQLGLMARFRATDRGPVFLNFVLENWNKLQGIDNYSKLTGMTVPTEYTAADGSLAFQYAMRSAAGLRELSYYKRSYNARIKLAGRGYQSKTSLSGEFLAQAGSVFNASSLWLQKFATRASYRPIDENLLRQLKSDQLMRQWVAWGYDSTKGFWVNPEMLSMADRGRADPKQDGLGHKNTAGVFSTNPSEKMQMASQFYPAVNATQIQNLNRTNAQYEQMLGRDAQEYQNNLQN